MKRILILFPKDWDRDELAQPRFTGRYQFFYEGFDLFTFPENARLITFNVRRYIDRLVDKALNFRTLRHHAVIFNAGHESI